MRTGPWCASALAIVCTACLGDAEWWSGEGEPELAGLAANEIPLSIFLSQHQTDLIRFEPPHEAGLSSRMERSLDPRLEVPGAVPSDMAGIFYMDGKSLDDSVVLILSGQLHRYDGPVEDHLLAVQPEFFSQEAGAANPDGFLRIDLKKTERIHVYGRNGAPLGTAAGVFRGQIVAARIPLHGGVSADLTRYAIQPLHFGERPPNLIADATLFIRPSAELTLLRPSGLGEDPCQGDDVVDASLAATPLEVEVTVGGFPAQRPVTVEVRYRVPHWAGQDADEHLWDYVSNLWADDEDVVVQTAVIADPATNPRIRFPDWTTPEPAWREDVFAMTVEVRAYCDARQGPSAQSAQHELLVVDAGEDVVVEHFELCPAGDGPCHSLRDGNEPPNVVARRNVVEWAASRDGYYDTITRPLGRCAGGTAVGGNFADDCTVYRESEDAELSTRVSAQLDFELTVDGEAKGSASWGRVLPGIGGADLEAELKATFELEAELSASFSRSALWRSHHSLDVLYDPSDTQIQWWRVVTPRMRFAEVAQLDACGTRTSSHQIFLSDLRDSRLVLACEAVPSYDAVCHAVEPTAETVAACNERLIPPDSDRGRQCLGVPAP